MYNYFFHSLKWDNDVYVMYVVWAILIPVSFYLIRFLYKSIRKPRLRSRYGEFYTNRDLFLAISGQEYLVLYAVLYALYIGFWVYKVALFALKEMWSDWHTYLIILPQVATLVAIVVIFFARNNNFSKQYIK